MSALATPVSTPIAAAANDFSPRIVLIDDEPALVMNRWDAVLVSFGIHPGRAADKPDLLTRLQVLALRCALGIADPQEACRGLLVERSSDDASVCDWLNLCIEAYLARPGSLAAAHALLQAEFS